MVNNDFKNFMLRNVLLTSEVSALLNVSKQYLNVLSKKGVLVPLKGHSNANVYLLQDILKYMETKRSFQCCDLKSPDIIYDSLLPRETIEDAINNLHLLGDIECVSLYFNGIDAVNDMQFSPIEESRNGDLIELFVPNIVIRDVSGREMWLLMNCLLSEMLTHFQLLLEHLSVPVELFRNICDHEFVKIFYEDGQWSIYSKNTNFKNNTYHISCRLVMRHGRISLIHDEGLCLNNEYYLLEKYQDFIPQPFEFFYLKDDITAARTGYSDIISKSHARGVGKLILRDFSGRELWLNPKESFPKNQYVLNDLLKSCGITCNLKTDWANRILKKADPLNTEFFI